MAIRGALIEVSLSAANGPVGQIHTTPNGQLCAATAATAELAILRIARSAESSPMS